MRRGERQSGTEAVNDQFERDWVKARAAHGLFGCEPPRIGRYELGPRIGVGGMGLVYAANDPELDREVAIKLVRVFDPQDREATHAEAQAIARVTHPNVVPIYDVGIVEDRVFLVMELVRGPTLREFAAESEQSAAIVRAYRQACEGLAAAHKQNLVHRDFKPDNAIVGEDGRVRVIDFGIAVGGQGDQSPRAGTPKYMAPEQRRGEPLSASADQYALCVSLEEALLGRGRPLAGWLQGIVERGTSDDPASRFPSLDELRRALGDDPRLRWRRRVLWGTAAVCVTSAFAIGTSLSSGREHETCSGGAASIEQAWSASERQQALARIEGLSNYGAAVAPRLGATLEAFVDSWKHVHKQVCEARRREEVTSVLYERQLRCLARARSAFAAVASVSPTAEPSRLQVVAVSLPDPKVCEDLTDLPVVPPPRFAIADEVRSMYDALAEVRASLLAGQTEAAYERVLELSGRATPLGYGPLIAELKLLEGRVLLSTGDLNAAEAPLSAALEAALALEDNELAIEAWARRAFVRARLSRVEIALDGIEFARPLAQRIGANGLAVGLFHNNVGVTENARGNRSAAHESLRRAVEVAKRATGPGSFELVHAYTNLAIATDDPAERDRLGKKAIARFETLLGSTHPETLTAIFARAVLVEPTDAKRGVALLRPTCNVWKTKHPASEAKRVLCLRYLGWLTILTNDEEAERRVGAELAAHDSLPTEADALAAILAGNPRQVTEILVQEPAAPSAASWFQVLNYGERLLLRGRARTLLGDHRGVDDISIALRALDSIQSPLPVVRQRIAVAVKWSTASRK